MAEDVIVKDRSTLCGRFASFGVFAGSFLTYQTAF